MIVSLGASTRAEAAWTQRSGEFYLKLWDQMLFGRSAYLAHRAGRAPLDRSYQDHSIRYHLEVGIIDDLTAVVRGNPIGWAKLGEESTFYSGMLSLGARYAFVRAPFPLAIEAHYGYAPPLGDGPLGSGTIEGQPWFYAPTLERHQGGLELQVGHALPWGWLKGGVGLRLSSPESIDPVLTVGGSVGGRTSFGLVGQLDVGLHHPFGDVVVLDVSGVGQTRYLGFNLSVGYWLTRRFAFNAGVGGVIFARSNAATPALSFGIELR